MARSVRARTHRCQARRVGEAGALTNGACCVPCGPSERPRGAGHGDSDVAQLVEQVTVNHRVTCSSHVIGAKKNEGLERRLWPLFRLGSDLGSELAGCCPAPPVAVWLQKPGSRRSTNARPTRRGFWPASGSPAGQNASHGASCEPDNAATVTSLPPSERGPPRSAEALRWRVAGRHVESRRRGRELQRFTPECAAVRCVYPRTTRKKPDQPHPLRFAMVARNLRQFLETGLRVTQSRRQVRDAGERRARHAPATPAAQRGQARPHPAAPRFAPAPAATASAAPPRCARCRRGQDRSPRPSARA